MAKTSRTGHKTLNQEIYEHCWQRDIGRVHKFHWIDPEVPAAKLVIFYLLCHACLGLLPVSTASPSMDHEHGTVCQPILEYQIRLCAPSSVI